MGKVVLNSAMTVSGVPYGEAVQAGDLVGWSSETLVRANGASGSVVVAAGVAAAAYESGDTGAMHVMCEVGGLAGLTIGATVYLSLTVPGGTQTLVPSGAGNLKQVVGYAVAADRIAVVLQDAGVAL